MPCHIGYILRLTDEYAGHILSTFAAHHAKHNRDKYIHFAVAHILSICKAFLFVIVVLLETGMSAAQKMYNTLRLYPTCVSTLPGKT